MLIFMLILLYFSDLKAKSKRALKAVLAMCTDAAFLGPLLKDSNAKVLFVHSKALTCVNFRFKSMF